LKQLADPTAGTINKRLIKQLLKWQNFKATILVLRIISLQFRHKWYFAPVRLMAFLVDSVDL